MTLARRLPAALVVALALSGAAARAQGPPVPFDPSAAPGPDSLLADVEVGFDGACAWRVPAPVWITLENRRDRELVVRVVLRSRLATTERAVQLPAGSRKRVSLNLALEDDLRLELREGGVSLEERLLPFEVVERERHLLVLDGRPPERRAGGASRRDEQVLGYSTIDAASAPLEAACYAAVGGVLLREADPAAWSVDQREALLEFVREGGLLMLADVTTSPKALAATRFFDGLAGSAPASQKVIGRPARARQLGRGRVIAFSDDPLLAAVAGANAADVKQRLGDLLAEGAAAHRWPRPTDSHTVGVLSGAGASTFTQLLVVGFVVVYFLAVGPLLAIVLRRAPRRRLALTTAGLVLGFTLLAPLVAGGVRTGAGEAWQRSVLWVPEDGPAVELGEVVVVSGGATRYELDVAGPPTGGALAVTVVEGWTAPEDVYRPSGWLYADSRPAVMRTARGPRPRVEVDMPPWGTQRVLTQALRPDARPLRATVEAVAGGGFVRLENTSGVVLEAVAIATEVEPGERADPPFRLIGTLLPGQQREVLVPRGNEGRGRSLQEQLGLPWEWRSWTDLGLARDARVPAGRTARYRVISRVAPGAAVSGPNLTTVTHGLRIDPVTALASRPRGYLGVALEDVDGAVWISPLKGGPGERAGLRAGDRVVTIEGQPVTTSEELRRLVSARAPGEAVAVVVRGGDGQEREHRVVLARAPGD
jgi:hypothetical protein